MDLATETILYTPMSINVNVYLPSLMMKVPDHLYILGDTYTGHT
jgi:hypothetical protein